MTTNTPTVHRLKVTLRHVTPPVWRRIEVVSDIKLSGLAAVLEATLGWHGGHLHAFEADKVRYQMPDPDFDDVWMGPKPIDERKVRLGDLLTAVRSKMRWEYDFGDGWEHDIVVEAIAPARNGARYPICLTGSRACPPDDCGGPWGYANLLAAVQDPSHPDHALLIEWLPEGFDPQDFDANATTERMRSPRPRYGW